ncbi:cysteine hydrolase family protein [Lactococcus lactis]|uniref:cysteine hydrolase family protein n=1 Tax=Lactococcus lactis TaxID=1358 RepID=UPI0022E8ED4E|nr:cysteine hydrolase family protein [Lactococcus lactis]
MLRKSIFERNKKMKTSDALIVIDMQNEVCAGIYRREELIEQINQRIITYRKAKKPIIFIQHNDDELIKESFGWQMIPELLTESTDKYVEKTHANGFYQTELQKLLTDLSVKLIEFCGAQTEFCVNTTLVFAHGLGYQNWMQRGASSTFDSKWLSAKEIVDFYENHLWDERFLQFLD